MPKESESTIEEMVIAEMDHYFGDNIRTDNIRSISKKITSKIRERLEGLDRYNLSIQKGIRPRGNGFLIKREDITNLFGGKSK